MRPMKPSILTSDVVVSTGSRRWLKCLPKTSTIRRRVGAAGRFITSVSLCMRRKVRVGLAKTTRSNSVMMLRNSVSFDLRNFRRAGTLKKRFLTEKMAPSGQASGAMSISSEPSIVRRVPNSVPRARVRSSTCATAAMEGSASPRKPIVRSEKRSSAAAIFEVACRSKAMRASVSDMPLPSSITWISARPASLMWTVMCMAPASTAFSISSFTTEAGR